MRCEKRAGGTDGRADVGRPLAFAGKIDRMDHARIVAEVDEVVVADDGSRFGRGRGAIFPADLVAVAVQARQCARGSAPRGAWVRPR